MSSEIFHVFCVRFFPMHVIHLGVQTLNLLVIALIRFHRNESVFYGKKDLIAGVSKFVFCTVSCEVEAQAKPKVSLVETVIWHDNIFQSIFGFMLLMVLCKSDQHTLMEEVVILS